MRRLLIWIGLFGLTVWATLRVLRALDSIPPRTDAIYGVPTPPGRDGISPGTDSIDSVPTPPDTDAAPSTDVIPSGTDSIDGVPTPPDTDDPPLEAYCARCRTRRVLTNVREETTANGRRAARGVCAVCATTVFTFLPAKQAT
jgi:DNA topoisomerase-1